MKYSILSILNLRMIVSNLEYQKLYKLHSCDFTRNRKMTFENTVYYILNKKGLTSKMEIEEFQELINKEDISSVAVLKQREKLDGEIFNKIRNTNLESFYNMYNDDVKLFNGYLLFAVDGSYFEIPNTLATRINYDSKLSNTTAPRALVSNYFDVLNHFVVNTVIDKESADEKDLDERGFSQIKELDIPYPIIRVKDRGYAYLKDFYHSNKSNDKYVVRLKKSDYKNEISNMKSDDEFIEIKYNRQRIHRYKKTDPDFYEEMHKEEKSVFIRIVRITLPSGEVEHLATNLTSDEVSYDDMKILYNLRWQIELNYHLLKESLKIETITSSKDELIKQDIFSQMLAFNLLQSFISDSQKDFDEKGLKYKHEMKINKNMAIGFFKKSLILIVLEKDENKQNEMIKAMSEKMQKYTVPVRKNRKYKRSSPKDRNKYSLNKRKAF